MSKILPGDIATPDPSNDASIKRVIELKPYNAAAMAAETTQLDDPVHADEAVERAARVFAAGGLVVFPTETVYGVGASVANTKGYELLRRLKQRPDDHPFAIHLDSAAAAERYIDLSSPRMRRAVHKLLPGPVTLVVDVDEDLIHTRLRQLGLGPEARDRLYWNNTVGLRCPDHVLGRQILASIDEPIVASSANRRGQPGPRAADAVSQQVVAEVGLVVDGGPCRFGQPSTVVHISGSGAEPRISVKRTGVYDEGVVRRLLRWSMLLVCSGNTCRSAMAAAMARQSLAQARSISVDDLDDAGLCVSSGGVAAMPAQPATAEAIAAMQKMGIDLTRHRAQQVTPQMLQEADVIYCMTESHRHALLNISAVARDKTFLLDANGDIDDPYGAGPTTYQRCAELIRRRLTQRLGEQQP
jgi:tRNA threonylcarbamoyl adenosine modification protein (Sua5/YciO/YrdC/YwlC family)